MIITDRIAGPSYSTDSTAAALSATLAIGRHVPAARDTAVHDDAGAKAALDLDALYPSLFAGLDVVELRPQIVRAVAVRCGVAAGCIAMLLTAAHH